MSMIAVLLPVLAIALAQSADYALRRGMKYASRYLSHIIPWLIVIGGLCEGILLLINRYVGGRYWLYLFSVGVIGVIGAMLMEIMSWRVTKAIR